LFEGNFFEVIRKSVAAVIERETAFQKTSKPKEI